MVSNYIYKVLGLAGEGDRNISACITQATMWKGSGSSPSCSYKFSDLTTSPHHGHHFEKSTQHCEYVKRHINKP